MRVSVLIPSRNEPFLPHTVEDVLAKARGDVEIIVTLDGYWPDHPLPDAVTILHRGDAQGMRPNINAMAAMATGDIVMKLDAHCMLAEGFDVTLAEACDDNMIVVPRRYPLDPERWAWEARSDDKYPIDYHYLSYPLERPDDLTCGLHGTEWRQRRDQRPLAQYPIDDEMSSQGSCWVMRKTHWQRLGDMDSVLYGNFVHEFQELGLKTWLGGGAVKVVKTTWYDHLFKGRRGRGYTLGPNGHRNATKFVTRFWMSDQYGKATRPLRWLIEYFGGPYNPSTQTGVPGWPANWEDEVGRYRREKKGPWAG